MNQIVINYESVFLSGFIVINNDVFDLIVQIYVIYERIVYKDEEFYYLQIKFIKRDFIVFVIYLLLNIFIKCFEIIFCGVFYLYRYKIVEGCF